MKIDKDTMLLEDFDQYRLDLEYWNKKPEAQSIEFYKAYSLLSEYNIPDASPKSMDLLS
jgi:hypothetical protein